MMNNKMQTTHAIHRSTIGHTKATRRNLQAFLFLLNLVSILAQSSFPQECQNYAPPAVIKGNKIFVSTTGQYLPIKGVNYYPRPNAGDLVLGNSQDFYTEAFRSSWERDIEQFKALGVNAIRLYAVDPGQNHDAFMCALKAAGIYVIVGLAADCQNCAVQWQDPPLCYPDTLRIRGEFIIREFSRYENVLGFSAGNEIALSAASYLGNLPCQKKFLRDMRAYVKECVEAGGMRHIPIGIIFADHERELKAKYYNCRTDPDDELENAEFLGINSYLHCDGSATDIDQLIGYKTLLAGVAQWGMTVPIMWTEFGCLNAGFQDQGEYKAQRNFLQVEALFSPEYREHFNGGFVFEYSTEKVYSEQTSPYPFTEFGFGNYGVGYFSPENCTGTDIPCEYNRFPQFQSLASRYSAVDVSDEVTLSEYNPPALDPPSCPDRVPGVGAFQWPTDFDVASTDRNYQCPALVPVYCVGVPAACVTVPHPGAGDLVPVKPEVPTVSPSPTLEPSFQNTSAPSSTVPTTDSPTSSLSQQSSAPGPTATPSINVPTNTSSTESFVPSSTPSVAPSLRPSSSPSSMQTSVAPTKVPSTAPSLQPSGAPSQQPSIAQTQEPSQQPFQAPSLLPTSEQTSSASPSVASLPTTSPTDFRQVSVDLTGDGSEATSGATRSDFGRIWHAALACLVFACIQL